MSRNKSGFTLIELLVVVAIIGILATIVLVFITSARGAATASAVHQQLRSFRTQMEVNAGSPPEYLSACNGQAIKNIVTGLIRTTGTNSNRLNQCYPPDGSSAVFSTGIDPFSCGCVGDSDWVFWIDLDNYDGPGMTCLGSKSDILGKIVLNGSAPTNSCQ